MLLIFKNKYRMEFGHMFTQKIFLLVSLSCVNDLTVFTSTYFHANNAIYQIRQDNKCNNGIICLIREI